MISLNQDTIPFGKFKGLTLTNMLKDRKYCQWVLKQPWFPEQYEYLYNRVKEYDPKKFFLKLPVKSFEEPTIEQFLKEYTYFHLVSPKKISILDETEKICYKFYISILKDIKHRIVDNYSFDIKAPTKWLKKFELETNLSRNIFKDFLNSYELPNIPYIIEDIKKLAGIDYKGAKSYLIAKEKSIQQEKYWEKMLKDKYGEDIGSQYKWEKCIFDFIHINNNTIYECKLGLKDFDTEQYKKYKLTLNKYDLVYLISTNTVIDIVTKTIWTTDVPFYISYLENLDCDKNKFDKILKKFSVKEIVGEGISDYL